MAEAQYAILVWDEETESWDLIGPLPYSVAAERHRRMEENDEDPPVVLIKLMTPLH